MPFVRRDAEGKVEAVFAQPEAGAIEELPYDDPSIKEFLHTEGPGAEEDPEWVHSDLSLVRVIEDLVDILIDKGVLSFTDLPVPAQQKLMGRRGLRKDLEYVAKLFPDDDDEHYYMAPDDVYGDQNGGTEDENT